MKKIFLILALLLAACATPSQEKTYSVYEQPGPDDQGTLPKYRVKEMPDGELRVHEYGEPFEYKYRIMPYGKIYKYGDRFEPVGYVRDGLPTTTKKGK